MSAPAALTQAEGLWSISSSLHHVPAPRGLASVNTLNLIGGGSGAIGRTPLLLVSASIDVTCQKGYRQHVDVLQSIRDTQSRRATTSDEVTNTALHHEDARVLGEAAVHAPASTDREASCKQVAGATGPCC